MPSQTFSHQATTTAPVEEVWAALDLAETWEAIGGVDRVFDAQVDDRGRLAGFSFDTVAAGRKYVGVATPSERVDNERMAWNVENSEIRGVTSVALSPNGAGTSIEVTLQVESVGMLSSMFFSVIAGVIGRGLADSVDGFAAGLGD